MRVILGPQNDAFTDEGLSTFLSSTYVVSAKSDRIGCRLEGPRVTHRESPDIVSDGVAFGAVQVAGDGLPMILVADRGTTGGYTKIATVISVDLPRIAQAMPGDRIAFQAVSLDEAHRALEADEAVLRRLARSAPVVFSRLRLHVRVDDTRYSVSIGLAKERGAGQGSFGVGGEVDAVSRGTSTRVHVEVVEPRSRG